MILESQRAKISFGERTGERRTDLEKKKSTGANKGYIACPKAGRLGIYPVSNYLYRVDTKIALNRRGTQRTLNR